MSNARREERLAVLAGVQGARHRVEEVLQEGKGEVGLGHYEVRSWVGWHHHMTLSLLALWFLALERRQLGKKTPALTVAQLQEVFSRLLQQPPPSPGQIAKAVSQVLRRNEEARIYHWYHKTKTFPPRRSLETGAAGAPRKKRLQ